MKFQGSFLHSCDLLQALYKRQIYEKVHQCRILILKFCTKMSTKIVIIYQCLKSFKYKNKFRHLGISCATSLYYVFISEMETQSPQISFIHFVVCLTTGPYPLPKPVLQRVRSSASSSISTSPSFLKVI